MPEYFRSLIVILALSSVFFAFAGRPASAIIGSLHFTTRRNLWFGLTFVAFLAHNFWVYAFLAIPMLIYSYKHETNPPALFFFVLFALPIGFVQIPGMGLINFLFELSHQRIMALAVLLPAFFSLIQKSETISFGRTGPDKVLATYLLLGIVLYLRDNSVTNTTRIALNLFIDVFLPYFVISRSLTNLQAFRDALLSIVLAIMVLAPIAMFEFSTHWLLYSSIKNVLGLESAMTGYLGREGRIRAIATAGQPIALGYLMVVAIGFYLFLLRTIRRKLARRIGMGILGGGLIAALSRGPWLGAASLILAFVATGRKPAARLTGLALAAMLTLAVIPMLPGGEKVYNLLPFIGTTEKGGIDYREDLITNSMIVIQRNPWFGSVNYLDTPEMQGLIANHKIDVVNTYVQIALERGLVGLGLFVSFFALVLIGVYRAMRSISDKDSEEHLLGRALLSTLLAILLIITTVSSISIIPVVYWSVAGLGVAYTQMARRTQAVYAEDKRQQTH